jgi:hypothetical protein
VTLLIGTIALAAAADGLDRYPRCAEVAELPPSGPARLRVPLELRTPADPADASDLILVDATGRAVPVERVEGADERGTVQLPPVRPTADPERFLVDTGAFTLGGLRLGLPPGVPAARVTVSLGDEVLAREALVWSLEDSASGDVALSGPVKGVLTVDVTPTTRGMSLSLGPTFVGLRDAGTPIPDHRVPVEVAPPIVQENGWARTALSLDQPLPVGAVEVEASDPLYERGAGLAVVPWAGVEHSLGPEPEPGRQTRITRAAIGELRVAQEVVTDRVDVGAGDQLLLLVDSQGKVPLDVVGATVRVRGVDLVALDVGEGPHQLCGGAPPGTTPTSPLGDAAAELARIAGEAAVVGPVWPNPAFVPPEIRSNLAAPSAFTGGDRLRWGRIVAGTGLTRIGVPDEVLARARPDLGDLRLLIDDGARQLPYLLEREPTDRLVDGVTSREDRGGRTGIAVKLPARGLRVSRIALRTDATTFEREVVVSVPAAGNRLRPVRAVRWVGDDRPGVLMIDVGATIDDELLITIENGDDPPLPVTGIDVAVAGYALLAVLPEGGAVLAYGDPALGPPSYDLALLRGSLHGRALAVPSAEVGPEAARSRPPLSTLDRALLAIGIGGLALGLILLAGDLVRRLPNRVHPEARDPGTPA